MATKLTRPRAYFVGVDGGATRCRARIYDHQGQLLGAGEGGPANPANGLALSQQSICDAISQALQQAGLSAVSPSSLIVGAGLAGLHLPSLQQAMAAWQHPFAQLYLTTDLHAALLGAHGGEEGGVIILGTGFSALGIAHGQQFPIGGYGFPIYATCSGSWFGLELIKAVLLAADGLGPASPLTQRVLHDCPLIALAEKMNNAPAQDFATYAPLVFEYAAKHDPLAQQLLEQGADFINKVLDKLVANGVRKIALIGGVAAQIQPWLASRFNPFIVPARELPEYGVMLWAKQQFLDSNNN